ncbi:MAG: hypothetical protein AB7G11_16080 [Phycisphaerales bacterium]
MTSVRGDAKTRVLAGAKLLDQKYDRWYRHVEAGKVEVLSFEHCPVAQLHNKDYARGLAKLGIDGTGWEYGFAAYLGGDGNADEAKRLADALDLNAEWREAITARRARMR